MFRTLFRMMLVAAPLALLIAFTSPDTPAQQNNNQGNQNNRGGNAGIKIDAAGVVSLAIATDANSGLDKKRREAIAKQALAADILSATPQRAVSLVKLEQRVDECLKDGKPIPDDVFYMAGLLRIDNVFVYPEEKDLVLVGPAEGFAPDSIGRMIGVESGRPVLRLDDMVEAMRAISRTPEIGCSIDPVPENLARLQKFVSQGGAASAAVVEGRFKQMDDILGPQDVRIDGVPATSHFGITLLEADYRMKRISIGLENPNVKGLKSHLQMLTPGANTIQRWWFVPLYDSITRSEDGLAYQLAGQRVQLLSQEEMSDAKGNRAAAATTRVSTQAFSKQFTEKYPELAERSPLFAELQSLVDWSILAALIQKERLAEKAGWQRETLMNASRLKFVEFNTPKKVLSLVNYKRSGNVVIGLVGGGVTIRPNEVLNRANQPSTGSTSPGDSGRNGSSTKGVATNVTLTEQRTKAKESDRSESHPWWQNVSKR